MNFILEILFPSAYRKVKYKKPLSLLVIIDIISATIIINMIIFIIQIITTLA